MGRNKKSTKYSKVEKDDNATPKFDSHSEANATPKYNNDVSTPPRKKEKKAGASITKKEKHHKEERGESTPKFSRHSKSEKTPEYQKKIDHNNNHTFKNNINNNNNNNTPKYSNQNSNNNNTPKYNKKNESRNEKTQPNTLTSTAQIQSTDAEQFLRHSAYTYEKLNKISEGTYGTVWRAKHKETNQIVALKKLKLYKEKEGFSVVYLREIKALMQHQHPNVVRVLEIVTGNRFDSVFIVMEFLPHDLRSMLDEMKSNSFHPSHIKCLLQQLLQGVAFLHSKWLMHRDLKPQNILMDRGILKLADFGSIREFGSPLRAATPLVCTRWYSAPELLFEDDHYDSKVDMWSVGCIFVEIVTKDPLFNGSGQLEQLEQMFHLLGVPTEAVWPGMSQLPVPQKISLKGPAKSLLWEDPRFQEISSVGISLLEDFLTWDPKKRISAQQALDHDFFYEQPRACEPAFVPSWPSTHEESKPSSFITSPSKDHNDSYWQEENQKFQEEQDLMLGKGFKTYGTSQEMATTAPLLPAPKKSSSSGQVLSSAALGNLFRKSSSSSSSSQSTSAQKEGQDSTDAKITSGYLSNLFK